MPKSLKSLKPDDVKRNLTIIKQLIHEADPEIALDRGPFHDLVLYYSAIFSTQNQHDIADAMRSIHIGKLVRDPNSAEPELVDRVLGNWMVKRRRGSGASGLITLSLSEQIGIVIPAGTRFTAKGHEFRTRAAYQIRTHANHLTESDRLLARHGQGDWAVTIPVVSTTSGSLANLRTGTALRFDKGQMPRVRRAIVATDFVGGADEESNAQMVARLVRQVGGKVISNRLTCEALITSHPKYERNTSVSIIGFGDAEMVRDQHSLWPGSTGGRIDIYVKTPHSIAQKQVKVRGYFVKETASSIVWEIPITRLVAPGFFRANSVVRDTGRPCAIQEEIREFSVEGAVSPPDVQTPFEAAYSMFQAVRLVVEEQTTRKAGMKSADLVVNLLYMPGIDELQESLVSRSVASPATDVLVKAAVPCITTVDMEIQRRASDPEVRTEIIKEAVAAAVNATGFSGQLSTTTVLSVVGPYLEGAMAVMEVGLLGQILCPDGTIEVLPAASHLHIPTNPIKGMSPRTVAFFLDPDDVRIRIVTVDEH